MQTVNNIKRKFCGSPKNFLFYSSELHLIFFINSTLPCSNIFTSKESCKNTNIPSDQCPDVPSSNHIILYTDKHCMRCLPILSISGRNLQYLHIPHKKDINIIFHRIKIPIKIQFHPLHYSDKMCQFFQSFFLNLPVPLPIFIFPSAPIAKI